MGAFTPLVTTIGTAAGTAGGPVGTMLGMAMSGAGLLKQNQIDKAQRQAWAADHAAQAERMRQAQQIDENSRRDRLRQVQASQRARFGAMGVGSTEGSARALLDGLATGVEGDIAAGRRDTEARLGALSDNLQRRTQASLLESGSRNSQWLKSQLGKHFIR